MEKELWLSRDDDGGYSISEGEPQKNEYGYFHPFLECLGNETFHNLFKARLRKGRKRKIKRILIELED
jgi:hypothetical protein